MTPPADNVVALAPRSAPTPRSAVEVEIDDWGRDEVFVGRLRWLAGLRWNVAVGGLEHVPRGGALIVVNARRLALAPVFTALSIGAALDRPVRFVGRPDVAPLGPTLQRLGGLLPLVDEVAGALRGGSLVVLGADHTSTNLHCGRVDHELVGAAVAARVPVVPAAALSSPTGRGARVEVGPAVRLTRRRRGPLAEVELAEQVRQGVDALIGEAGGQLTGTPLDWLPIRLAAAL